MYVDDIKVAGKKQNIDPLWKVLVKDFDLREFKSSSTVYICVALKENVRLARVLRIITEVSSNQGLLPRYGKIQETKSHGETWVPEREGRVCPTRDDFRQTTKRHRQASRQTCFQRDRCWWY